MKTIQAIFWKTKYAIFWEAIFYGKDRQEQMYLFAHYKKMYTVNILLYTVIQEI